MATRRIVKQGDDILKKRCKEVTDFGPRLWTLLDDMRDTMKQANGAGIAASQVGIMKRACLVMLENESILEMINPEIISSQGEEIEAEGCLSLPGVYGMVKRPSIVKIKAQDRNGKWYMKTGEGYTARAFCHEIDHLDGKFFTDFVIEYLKPKEE